MATNFKNVLNFIRSVMPDAEEFINSEDDLLLNITEIFSDSRKVVQGSLFCCITGEKSDGHKFAEQAVKNGAVALLCERKLENLPVPQIVIKGRNIRDVLGDLSAFIYDKPCEKMLMVGVTGTNGKTTTTYIIRSILQAAGIRTGLLGTVIESDGIHEIEADRTTPESSEIQKQLYEMLNNNCGACVMETSSHGLFLGRLKGTKFDIPIFTNLFPEHLDFHKNMNDYFAAKELLFTKYSKDNFIGAANFDDPYGKMLIDEFEHSLRGFGMSEKAPSSVIAFETNLNGSQLLIQTQGFENAIAIKSPLAGKFNIMNTLCAVTAMRGRVDDEAIINGVANVPQVPGRLERINLPNGALCFVDFAHTPSALENVLKTVWTLSGNRHGKIISLFGHGGGRYELNRPELGRVAAQIADEIIVTSDNARDEDPAKIAEAIVSGIKAKPYKVILDRPEAVNYALNKLNSNDILIITGKGPERFITIGNNKIPFNDAEAVKKWAAEKI